MFTASSQALHGAAPSGAAAGSAVSPQAYFRNFRPCRCGHSSGWHAGAFQAWRSGTQPVGRCEYDAGADRCSCLAFAAEAPGLRAR